MALINFRSNRSPSWLAGVLLVIVLALYHVTTAAQVTSQPWRSPCGDVRHLASSGISSSLRQLRGEGGGGAVASEATLQQLLSGAVEKLDDSVALVQTLKSYIRGFFRSNVQHIRQLERLPELTQLRPQSDITPGSSIEHVILHIYELFTRIAIFSEHMKQQLQSALHSHDRVPRLRQLHVLESGGTWAGSRMKSGIYPVLCDIYRSLPTVLEHLDDSIIPSSLSSPPTSSAMHHNRDYFILHNMEQALMEVQGALQSFLTPPPASSSSS